MNEAYVVEAVRTATGRRKGALAETHPIDLGAQVLNALAARTGIDPAALDDVVMGCVTQGGEQAFAFGRNCVLASDYPVTVPATTVDRQCGSSQQAVQFATQAVMSGTQDMVVAAGVESMTRVPMFSNLKLYEDAGIGTGSMSPMMINRFGVPSFSQFAGAQKIAENYGFSREDLDAFAVESHKKAAAAIEAGMFKDEIVPVKTGDGMFDTDEGVRPGTTVEILGGLNPIEEGGVLTAGNASQMSDGSAGLLIANERAIKAHGLTPIARIAHVSVSAGDPIIMLEEPIRATRRALEKSGMSLDDIDIYEVNEAFASIPMAWLDALNADPAKLNVRGGAIALGHPLGASGARLMTTMIHALRDRGEKYGLQTMCEGGGTANVTIIEAL
ncbi:acetyl-CoA C-acyltransferase [Altericroceibacterium spongiae]|uniref:Acetyl-CoA C-acyltransferase n=1 Tax=Altericroceibacterium spongiae TaxID=2320269 RepID=A0A420EQW8_9SPHN|nr:acetyl-CoA C-acetyltransferase [Altericroceibacterium spongiae]RKF23069.1 acetyl-CoA C-acyltransferase [Altericroceibacterium spongiae]